MNIKRSYLKLAMSSVTVGLFLANCTVKESQSDECERGDKDTGCECPDGAVGYQVCNSSGVFGSCQCPGSENTAGTSGNGGSSSSTDGGAPSGIAGKTHIIAGADAGGAPTEPGAGGAGGEGGAGFPVFATCEECLMQLCATELDACLNDVQCFSADGDGSGEYEAISTCIESERASGVAKRDAVRGCGVTFGASSNPDLASDWAPQDMAATTTNLLNCMATSSSQTPNANWANDPANFPNNMPAPWPEDSCAKLACTSAK
jgi:hypothetical protein